MTVEEHTRNYKRYAILIPTYRESSETLSVLKRDILKQFSALEGVEAEVLFLCDGNAACDAMTSGVLFARENRGLAYTLLEGYSKVLTDTTADYIIRIDAQEQDVASLPEIVRTFELQDAPEALFLPVVRHGQEESMDPEDCENLMEQFRMALSPIDTDTLMSLWNTRFAVGFMAFTRKILEEIEPELHKAFTLYTESYGKEPQWGFDLLVMLLCAQRGKERVAMLFNGFTDVWEGNVTPHKISLQKQSAQEIIAIARLLLEGTR